VTAEVGTRYVDVLKGVMVRVTTVTSSGVRREAVG